MLTRWRARVCARACSHRSSIIEYALKMATGDASVPKGGDPKYRSGEWYKTCFGKEQGEFMAEENAKEYGHGAHADEPYRFVTIERKMTALRKWYDEVLKEEMIANPARNNRLKKVRARACECAHGSARACVSICARVRPVCVRERVVANADGSGV
jgi:hypothetical protein